MSSEQLTSIHAPGKLHPGIVERGKLDRKAIIDKYRGYLLSQKLMAETILAMPDDMFIVEQYKGAYVRKNLVELKP